MGPEASVSMEKEPHLYQQARKIADLAALIGVFGMLTAAIAIGLDIALRWIVGGGVRGLNEVLALAFGVGIAACVPAGLAGGQVIRVELFPRFFERIRGSAILFAGDVLLLIMFAVLAWQVSQLAIAYSNRTTVILRVGISPFYWLMALMLAFGAAIQAIKIFGYVGQKQTASNGEAIRTGWILKWATTLALLVAAFALAWFVSPGISNWSQAHPVWLFTLVSAAVWALILLSVPVTAVLGLLGLVGCILLVGTGPALNGVSTEVLGFITNSQAATLPLFLMMGSFAAIAGISDDLFGLAQALLKPVRGGLSAAAILGCGAFGTVSGSSLATVAGFGKLVLPQMRKSGYKREFAAACVAAGGTLGSLIPPSSILVVYGLMTETSIGALFMATLFPGVLCCFLFMATAIYLAGTGAQEGNDTSRIDWSEVSTYVSRCGPTLALIVILFGGLFAGLFTSSETAAIGTVAAFLLATFRGRVTRQNFLAVMSEIVSSTAMIYLLIIGVMSFSFFVTVSGVAEDLVRHVQSQNFSPLLVVVVIVILMISMGCIMDAFSTMLIVLPVTVSVIVGFGYDLVWWGVVNLIIIEIGVLTPPFGLHLFMLKALDPSLSLTRLYLAILPFLMALSIALGIGIWYLN